VEVGSSPIPFSTDFRRWRRKEVEKRAHLHLKSLGERFSPIHSPHYFSTKRRKTTQKIEFSINKTGKQKKNFEKCQKQLASGEGLFPAFSQPMKNQHFPVSWENSSFPPPRF
jgi:hypothetical protein